MSKKYGLCIAEHCNDKGVRAAYRSLIHGCLLSVSRNMYCPIVCITRATHPLFDCLLTFMNCLPAPLFEVDMFPCSLYHFEVRPSHW